MSILDEVNLDMSGIEYRLAVKDTGPSGAALFLEHAEKDIRALLAIIPACDRLLGEAYADVAYAEKICTEAERKADGLEKLEVEIERLRRELAAAERDRDTAERGMAEAEETLSRERNRQPS